MPKICDHKSVGMLVRKDDKILLIERARPPFGFAAPAGHVDSNPTYEASAERELKEEVGLDTEKMVLLAEGRRENRCRREDGTWHYWKVYQMATTGDIDRSKDETKQAGWYTKEQIGKLAERTVAYSNGEIPDDDWDKNPGLEPIWFEWFKELGVL